ncbi:hypothetical protein ACFX2I_025003 [Malus domestica]|uniref:uncharacterized protein n=1 Tax=Malus domestica TaxID=3750 RepID=UPI003975CD99
MATFPKAMTKKNSNGRLKIRRRSGDINFFSSRYLSDKSDASRDAIAEWYMKSWNAEVSRVFFRSCFAFSSVKHPSANLDPARVGSEPGSLLLAFCPGSALMYSAGSEDQPKSGVHQLAEAVLRRFGPDRWEAEALGRIETGLKDVRGVAIVGAGSQCRKKSRRFTGNGGSEDGGVWMLMVLNI